MEHILLRYHPDTAMIRFHTTLISYQLVLLSEQMTMLSEEIYPIGFALFRYASYTHRIHDYSLYP